MNLERDFATPGRSPAIGDRGMAATSHPQATLAAVHLLREGGNAVDAAIAAVAVQSVVEPHMTGIGGDCFVLLAGPEGPVVALNGSGTAAGAARCEWYAAAGIATIEAESPHAVTVPGAIDAWLALHAAHGRTPLDRVLGPAIQAAREGFRVTPRVAWDWSNAAGKLARDPDAAAHYLPSGRPPRAGDRIVHEALARTLERVAKTGRSAFYEGEVADEIAAKLQSLGGLLSAEDFATYRSRFVEPISAPYRGHDVFECPPNGQGLAALMILQVLAEDDLADPRLSEADRIHLHAEATKAAYRVRDLLFADPDQHPVPVEACLSEAYALRVSERIDLRRARPAEAFGLPEHKDTVYLAVVDRDGLCVSFINSLFASFGCGIYAPRSGVMLHNRGTSFQLQAGHPNAIAPGKRPMHTIIPGLLVKDGRPVMPFGVMGGHYQAAGHAHFLSQMLDHGRDPQGASDAPRSFAFGGVLQLEPTIPEAVRTDLASRGHVLDVLARPMGGAQAIYLDHARGVMIGGSDARKDGMALAA